MFKTSVEIGSLKGKVTVSKSTFISLQVKHTDYKMFGINYTYFPVTLSQSYACEYALFVTFPKSAYFPKQQVY